MTDHDALSPSQQARLERLREPAGSTPLPVRLAAHIDDACDELDRLLQAGAEARRACDGAWRELCDRGWPADAPIEGRDLTRAFEWFAVWNEMATLPVTIETSLDQKKLEWLTARLRDCEGPPHPKLPEEVWVLIAPMDRTGRATLAWLLQAVVAWEAAQRDATSVEARRASVVERFALYRREAQKLGIRAPLAPLDLRAWRAAAQAVQLIAE
jgi:hypothetical protein